MASIKRHPVAIAFLAAAVFYLLCTFYYMGGALTDCHNSLMGGVGDETAGLIWLNSVNHTSPFWGFTHATNYPFGEQLNQPVNASGAAEYVVYWMLAKLAGSVCGYNLLNALGYMSASLIMFAFVRWLTRKSWIALLAGYAVAFTPYLQAKTGVHPSYVYEGLFIGILWIFLIFWQRPKRSLAIILGLLTAIAFYWDPYFVLLSSILWVGLLLASVCFERVARRNWGTVLRRLPYLALAFITLVVLILPLIYIRLHYAGQIDQAVTGTRNPIKFDAQIYGARPWEYFQPVATQPVLKWLIPHYAVYRKHHSSNAAEYTINLSLTLIGVIVIAGGILITRWKRKCELLPKRFFLPVNAVFLVACLLTVGALAMLFSFPPELHGIRMPTWYLTDFTTMWRVFARLYIIVNLAMVTLAALALSYLSALIRRPRLRVIGWVVVLLLVAFEYQTFVPPRTVWSYSADTPTVYYWLHRQASIHVIAEYSLDEPAVTGWPTFYQTFQRISGKDLINSSLGASPQAALRGSLRTLSDPQTLPSLRDLGADTVLVHGVQGNVGIPGLTMIYYEPGPPASANATGRGMGYYPIGAYHIDPGPKATFAVAPETGFVYPRKLSPIDYDYVGSNGSTMELLPLPKGTRQGGDTFCLNISSQAPMTEPTTFLQDGRVIWSGTISNSWQAISVPARLNDPITVKLRGMPNVFMLHDLGCES